jgi:sn-glycerol 3-phosphate transport system substrate-binding protein
MPVRTAAIQSADMQTFYQQHPNFKTTLDQLPKTRPQDSARELVPNGDEIIGKGLERISTNQEPAELVFKEVADQFNNEKQPVLRALKDLGEA